VTNYILEPTSITSTSWGPHNGPHADVYSIEGGYHFAGMSYNPSTHNSFATGCVQCHMPDIMTNEVAVPNHSFYAQLSACQGCHAGATDFNILNGQEEVKTELQKLRVLLNTALLLTQDGVNPLTPEQLDGEEWELDDARKQTAPVAKDTAGALYNYFVVARGSAFGVHAPRYTKQLLFDSIAELGGDPGPTRP
jgi:formate-dependent nitrite reductase cytochrome c552 subunit